MRIKRCIHDIIYDLLKTLSIENKMLKTRLCTATGLPLDRCNKILDLLVEHGLITFFEEDNYTYYSITEQGYIYISLYEQLQSILPLTHKM